MPHYPLQIAAETSADVWIKCIAARLSCRLDRPLIKIARAGRKYVAEYCGALERAEHGQAEPVEIEPATITINLDAIELNPWERIHLSIGHELIHHFIYCNGIDAAIHGHGAEFKRAARACGIPAHGRYARLPRAILPQAKVTRYVWICRCASGPRVRSRRLHARCLDCGREFQRADLGKVAGVLEHGIEVGQKLEHKKTRHRAECVALQGPDRIVVRLKSKIEKVSAADSWKPV